MVDHLGRLVDGDQLLYVIAATGTQRATLHGPGRRHRDEQPRARASRCASAASSSCAPRSATATFSPCCGRRRRARRRNLGAPALPRQDHHRATAWSARCRCSAVMKQTGPDARRAHGRHAAVPAGHDQRAGQRSSIDLHERLPIQAAVARVETAARGTRAASCCAPPAPSR